MKTTAKEKIIELMKWKNEQLKPLSDVVYSTEEDEAAIQGWSASECNKILKRIILQAQNLQDLDDVECCPFCLYKDRFEKCECQRCDYGKHHGICGDFNSDYAQLTSRGTSEHTMGDSICGLIGVKKLQTFIQELGEKK